MLKIMPALLRQAVNRNIKVRKSPKNPKKLKIWLTNLKITVLSEINSKKLYKLSGQTNFSKKWNKTSCLMRHIGNNAFFQKKKIIK